MDIMTQIKFCALCKPLRKLTYHPFNENFFVAFNLSISLTLIGVKGRYPDEMDYRT